MQIIRRRLWEQETDLTAVGHETSQKLRKIATIDTRGAAGAVSGSDDQYGAGMGLMKWYWVYRYRKAWTDS